MKRRRTVDGVVDRGHFGMMGDRRVIDLQQRIADANPQLLTELPRPDLANKRPALHPVKAANDLGYAAADLRVIALLVRLQRGDDFRPHLLELPRGGFADLEIIRSQLVDE